MPPLQAGGRICIFVFLFPSKVREDQPSNKIPLVKTMKNLSVGHHFKPFVKGSSPLSQGSCLYYPNGNLSRKVPYFTKKLGTNKRAHPASFFPF